MRTFLTLFVFASLVLVALVATAASPNPTLNVTCTLDGDSPTPDCASAQPIFSGDGLHMHKSYAVVATQLLGNGFIDVLSSVDKQGHYSELSSDGVIDPATWTFTLWELDHNGNLNKPLTTPQTLTFD
jgi:hypothetical protein